MPEPLLSCPVPLLVSIGYTVTWWLQAAEPFPPVTPTRTPGRVPWAPLVPRPPVSSWLLASRPPPRACPPILRPPALFLSLPKQHLLQKLSKVAPLFSPVFLQPLSTAFF